MPQLDSLTYFTQYFWFIICFIYFYLLLSDKIIPAIAIILKSKHKMMKSTTVNMNANDFKMAMEKKLLEDLMQK